MDCNQINYTGSMESTNKTISKVDPERLFLHYLQKGYYYGNCKDSSGNASKTIKDVSKDNSATVENVSATSMNVSENIVQTPDSSIGLTLQSTRMDIKIAHYSKADAQTSLLRKSNLPLLKIPKRHLHIGNEVKYSSISSNENHDEQSSTGHRMEY